MNPGLQTEPVKSPMASAIQNFFCLVVLGSASLATFGYLRALQPLYGTAASNWHLNKVVWAACIFGTFAPTIPIWNGLIAAGVLLSAMPVSAYWVAVLTGRMGDVIWGPVITHTVVLAPVLSIASALVKALQEAPDQNGVMDATSMIGLPVCRMAIMTLQDIWPLIPYLKDINETSLIQYIGSFAITIWILSPFLVAAATGDSEPVPPPPAPVASTPGTPKSKKKGKTEKTIAAPPAPPPRKTKAKASSQNHSWRVMMLPSIPLLMTFFLPPTLNKPLSKPWDHPSAPLRILSSVRSPYSGVVLVGQILPNQTAASAANFTHHSLRYLRAGHSILGGVWTDERSYGKDGSNHVTLDAAGTPLGDSIYSTFVMQEAARLVVQPQAPKTALTIGLGTGISASALARHGLDTTIVDVDAAVYEAAKKYFGLEVSPEKVFIQDGRGFVSRRRHARDRRLESDPNVVDDSDLYDIVVHDLFSGGSVPGHLFTTEFWEDLKAVMRPTGVVAVNFAGKLDSDSFRSVVFTLDKAFGHCRAFHDNMDTLTDEEMNNDFNNWVFFCTPSSEPIKFRKPTEADFLNSYLRDRVLLTLEEREVNLKKVLEAIPPNREVQYTLTDGRNPLVDWQAKDALHHWKVMREVLPDVLWETF
ncbi:hypothetical protein BXZ70DRAFT_946452 [Cristinia sonorae]|uniref:Spermine/spermidine synthase n=1 Tax=Cristinia sonorae TaxID=1940300 RepID=A0A8K0UJW6_9AGAR|nr:hypothetical protein BXZ70DRAFT_946452 [Cristinia sonorae]